MTMPSEDTLILNTQEEKLRFREKYTQTVHSYALEATGSEKLSQILTERVFMDVERRHANVPLPARCEMYLAATVYRLFAKGDITEPAPMEMAKETAAMASSPALIPKAEPPVQTPEPPIQMPEAPVQRTQPESVGSVSAPKEEPLVASQKWAPQYLPNEEQSEHITGPTPMVAVETPTSIHQAQLPDQPHIAVTEPDQCQADVVYDESSTVFWTPDCDVPVTRHEVPPPARMMQTFEMNPPKRSTFLSVLNGLLLFLSLAAIAFLLMELNILPSLFT